MPENFRAQKRVFLPCGAKNALPAATDVVYLYTMKLSELFKTRTVFSAEVFPPKKTGTMENVIRALRTIAGLNPDFVSITCGAGGSGGSTTSDVCSVAKDAFDLETMAHFTCVNMTKDKCREELDVLSRKGIHHILALRGDITSESKFYDFYHADELTAFIRADRPEFELSGACYPEGHAQAPSLDKDIDNLKKKIDAGVGHLISQLFFDNDMFFTFLDKARGKGIAVPVEAGIMPVLNAAQIKRMVSMCGASVPHALARLISLYGDSNEDMEKAGIDYACAQIEGLLAGGVDGIHLYSMNRGDVAATVYGRVRK